jgi:choice-of-anchor A domain-containing protein
MQNRSIAFLLAMGALAFASSNASAALSPLALNDLTVLGNLVSSSKVEGSAWIGGNLTGSSSNYASQLGSVSSSTVTLAVGGNISTTNGVTVSVGSITAGGTITGNTTHNQSGSTVKPLTAITPTVADMTQALTDESNYFKNLTTNSTATFPGAQPAAANFNIANGVTQAVFSISAASLFGNNLVQQINLNNDSASVTSIVINVSGVSVNDTGGGNFVGSFATSADEAKTIWNFYQATTINVANQLDGALLAPLAALTNSQQINGAVGVASFTQNADVHMPVSTVAVPEPAACAIIAAAGILMRRRSRN